MEERRISMIKYLLIFSLCFLGCVGPANAPDPCPVNCGTKQTLDAGVERVCCPIDNICETEGKCKPGAGPWGMSRDAGRGE
jgi:hypothetical protein